MDEGMNRLVCFHFYHANVARIDSEVRRILRVKFDTKQTTEDSPEKFPFGFGLTYKTDIRGGSSNQDRIKRKCRKVKSPDRRVATRIPATIRPAASL